MRVVAFTGADKDTKMLLQAYLQWDIRRRDKVRRENIKTILVPDKVKTAHQQKLTSQYQCLSQTEQHTGSQPRQYHVFEHKR